MGDHLPCTGTLSMCRLISMLMYLRSASTCLTRTRTAIHWLYTHAITDSVNKYHVFGSCVKNRAQSDAVSADLPSLLVYPVDYRFFLTPSTGLQGSRTFLMELEKITFLVSNFYLFIYLFFVWIRCLIIGSLQPVTKYVLFDN